ncbi:f-box domain-containing protein, partial [Colletotrichum incanum]
LSLSLLPDRHDLRTKTFPVLPDTVLGRIMRFICPHSQDETYETCEARAIVDACALCHLRDPAHSARVCIKWCNPATAILYQSIRIDVVHYCPRELQLSEQCKHKSFPRGNTDPDDVPAVRLRLFRRTLCDDDPRLGPMARYIKLPYIYALRSGRGGTSSYYTQTHKPSLRRPPIGLICR